MTFTLFQQAMGNCPGIQLSPYSSWSLTGSCQHCYQTCAGHMVEQQISQPFLEKQKTGTSNSPNSPYSWSLTTNIINILSDVACKQIHLNLKWKSSESFSWNAISVFYGDYITDKAQSSLTLKRKVSIFSSCSCLWRASFSAWRIQNTHQFQGNLMG